jgi:16S rRNA G966 N2-methylase RsmD
MATKPSAVIDTRVIYCGDNLDQLKKLPNGCVDLIYIDPPFNSNRNYEVFWGETKEKRSFADRHNRPRPTSSTCDRAAASCTACSK